MPAPVPAMAAPRVLDERAPKRGSSRVLKVALASLVAVLALGGAAGGYWWWSRPQIIKFSDDTKLTLLSADYGKRHVPPGGKTPAATARPATQGGARGAQPARRGPATITTATDTLVVWLRAKFDQDSSTPNQYHSFQFFIYDKAGTACAQAYGNVQPGTEVFPVQFTAFPRRQGTLYLRVQEQGNGGQEMSDGKFVIKNPAAGKSYPTWTPVPLPATKEDDGVSVKLTKLIAGAETPYRRVQDDPDGVFNKGVQVAYQVERGGKPVRNWAPSSVEITDATGNRTAINYGPNGNQAQWTGDGATLTLQNSLWPDEPAWKLRMEMTQNSDFSTDEQWTAQNVPVVPGSQQSFNGNGIAGGRRGGGPAAIGATPLPAAPTPFTETDMNGHHIKIFPAVEFTNGPARPAGLPANVVYNQPQQTGLMIQIQPAVMMSGMIINNGVNGTRPADDGLRMAVAKITDGQGGDIQSYTSGTSSTGMPNAADSMSTFRYMLQDTGGVTNINVTIALHKNRFFEFTVKPESATAEK